MRRGRDPGRGLWSIPGGKVEAGETHAEAAVREVREETGLVVAVRRDPWVVRVAAGDAEFEIHCFAAVVLDGTLRAGDDADEVRWVASTEVADLAVVDGLVDHLRRAGVLP